MLRSYLILFLFIFLNSLVLSVNAQSIISSSGSTLINENYILEFTLGELAIDEFENGIILTQGFHQGMLAIKTEIEEIDFKINLFPNPAHTHFKIEFNSPKTVDIIFTDIKGKIITREKLVNKTSKLYNVSNLARGIYIFTIIDSANKQATYKIKKIR